jgi:hypothetical protein
MIRTLTAWPEISEGIGTPLAAVPVSDQPWKPGQQSALAR